MASHTFPALDTNNIFTGTNDFQQGVQGVGLHAQIFTSNGIFVIPPGATAVKITIVGGGGGGGGSNASVGGGGGGSSGFAIRWLTGLVPGNNLVVAVGAGGAGGTANANGSSGTSSSVSSGTQTVTTITANPGGGGAAGGIGGGGGLAGVVSTGGDFNCAGAYGFGCYSSSTTVGADGGPGADSLFLGGTNATGSGFPGINGNAPGAGGSGGGSGSMAGGNGANGVVIFEWVQ